MEEHISKSAHKTDNSKGQCHSGTSVITYDGQTLQGFKPLSNICESFCGLHLYPNDNKRQINSYHYCGMLDEDRRQCLVYDDDSEHAKLIAFEYIISQKLFESLDENEKKYWHSHKYEIESGLLVQTAKRTDSGSTEFSEISSLQKLIDTYGKTIQLWPVDKQGKCSSKVPTGPPQILVSFTADSQVDPDLLRQRDEIMGIKTEDKKNERKGRVQGAPVDKDADQWISKGKPWQVYDNGNNGAVETRQ